ncbi:MAG: hypothetical protein AM325_013630 [Candidatus Thorarchaeota archaeon SMTZ1-45]|nr:MAG: hypothetical protein AM325_15155 [Candidatus Thorarchaeota archaeon SMTZ1-45]
MLRMKKKPARYSLVSVVVAAILLVSSLGIGTTDSSTLVLPGIALNDSPFVDISTDNLTSMESILYPSNYEVVSERPYIIRVDYQRAHFITEYDAEQAATQFINKVFSNLSVQQLEIDRTLTDLWRVLPRWRICFRNNTISDGIHIEARVIVNAITGGIIGYSGNPIMCQGEVANQSTAEMYATTALKELGYYIPDNSRIVYIDKMDHFNDNFSTYYFRFQEVVNNTMIDGEIGTIRVELDGRSGGIERLLCQWIEVDEIPTNGIVSMIAIGYGAVLTLYRVPEGDYNEIRPQDFRLCWVRDDPRSGMTVFDAFTGEVLYVMDTFGAFHSQDEVRAIFLAPLLISAIPATLLYLGTRKILRRQMRY